MSERGLPFSVRRLAEDGESGKIFANWLRSKLVTAGELRKGVGDVADFAIPIYVIWKDAVNDIARIKPRPAFYIRVILADRDEGFATLSYCKSDLCDDKGNLAIVRHADCAVLMPWWAVCNATLDKGDLCVWLSSAEVCQAIDNAQTKTAKSGEGNDGVEY